MGHTYCTTHISTLTSTANSSANNEQILPKLPGVACYINDMLITGKTAEGHTKNFKGKFKKCGLHIQWLSVRAQLNTLVMWWMQKVSQIEAIQNVSTPKENFQHL